MKEQRKIIEYMVVQDDEVNDCFEKGWELYSGPICCIVEDEKIMIYQAMVKYEQEQSLAKFNREV